MIHFISSEELAVALHRHDYLMALPLVDLAATRPTRTLAPLLHETTSVTGFEDGSERIVGRRSQGPLAHVD